MTKLIPNNFKNNIANLLKKDIEQNSYYFFLSDFLSSTDPIELYDYESDVSVNPFHNMIMGKKLTSNNIASLIRNIPYQVSKKFAAYDDSDRFIKDKDFYCIVDETSFFHVYKCLDNNFNSNSVIQPTFSDISGANTNFYRTSDGYIWKYMYSVSASDKNKFSTNEYFPVIANNAVVNSAVAGQIDVIKIDTAGTRYDNYVYGTFSASDLRINGNTIVYGIANSIASTVNTFYSGCLIYLSDGTGAGQNRTVTDYFVNEVGKYIVIDTAFSIAPTNGTRFQITPKVNIVGDGLQSKNAVARALINSFSVNSVYKIEMLEVGAGYSYATANVAHSNAVAISMPAEIRPIYSPYTGHGSNPAGELYSSSICVFNRFDSNTITVNSNSFSQFGIIKNPVFSSATLTISNNSGVFTVGGNLVKINPIRISANAVTNSASVIVTDSAGEFTRQVSIGTKLYLTNGSNSELVTVSSISNNTSMNLTSNSLFTSSNVSIYLANVSSMGKITSVPNTTTVTISNIKNSFGTGDLVIGDKSGATATVSSVKRSNVDKDFNTFIALHKYECLVVSGTFLTNEKVYSSDISVSNATLHSAIANGLSVTIYTSNQVGIFDSAIIGANSGAIATISAKYNPEVVFNTGEVVYLENIISTVRSGNGAAEEFKTIFYFRE